MSRYDILPKKVAERTDFPVLVPDIILAPFKVDVLEKKVETVRSCSQSQFSRYSNKYQHRVDRIVTIELLGQDGGTLYHLDRGSKFRVFRSDNNVGSRITEVQYGELVAFALRSLCERMYEVHFVLIVCWSQDGDSSVKLYHTRCAGGVNVVECIRFRLREADLVEVNQIYSVAYNLLHNLYETSVSGAFSGKNRRRNGVLW